MMITLLAELFSLLFLFPIGIRLEEVMNCYTIKHNLLKKDINYENKPLPKR